MAKKNRTDVLDLITNFQNDVLNKKPTTQEMYEEVRMMRFKIKPVQGNIEVLNMKNERFIETLWSLGKLDEFYQRSVSSLSLPQKAVFFRIFDDIYKKFHNELNSGVIKQENPSGSPSILEMEIFKDKPLQIN